MKNITNYRSKEGPINIHPSKGIIALVLTTIVIFLGSCEKYVDIKNSSQTTVIETANDCQLLLDDYSNMNTGYANDGTASSDDYYRLDAGYAALSKEEDKNIYTWQNNAIRELATSQWQNPYHVVYLSNLVLENAERLKGKESDAVLNSIKGQALFFRAYAWWNVAQLYTKPYGASSSTDPGIPLRTSSDIVPRSDRGTVQQTYTQIVNDLKEALDLLSPTSIVASRPNKASANAMLARVYLSMEDYSNALASANAALDFNHQLIDYNTLDGNSTSPFTRFNVEVIFQSTVIYNPLLDLGGGYGRKAALVKPELYNSYVDNDLRKTVFFNENISEVDYSSPDGTFYFTGNYESSNYNIFNGLAVDEMYLTRAECYARAGNKEAAMADLNTLLVTRWKKDGSGNTTYVNMSATTADEALEKILVERRKELVMRGTRWTDLRRLNKDTRFKVDLTRIVNGTTYTLPANDPRYTLLIPQEVITNADGAIPQNVH